MENKQRKSLLNVVLINDKKHVVKHIPQTRDDNRSKKEKWDMLLKGKNTTTTINKNRQRL